jgi:NADH-quinone oxidoreductase subunit H
MDILIDFVLLPLAKIVGLLVVFTVLGRFILALVEKRGAVHLRGSDERVKVGSLEMRRNSLSHLIAESFKASAGGDGARNISAMKALAPALGLLPLLAVFAIVPFMDFWCGGVAFPVDGLDHCFPSKEVGPGGIFVLAELSNPMLNPMLGHYFQLADLNAGLLYIFAVTGVSVYGAAITGWASDTKEGALGGLRSGAQMVSFEAAMGLALAGVLLVYGSVDVNEMVRQQGELLFGFIPSWGIFVQPLAFFVFIAASYARVKGAPFDNSSNGSDFVAGYLTEGSASKLSVFSAREFVEVLFISAMVATVFLGGWQVPWLYADGFHFSQASMMSAGGGFVSAEVVQNYALNGGPDLALPYWVVVLLRIFAFVAKVTLLCVLQVQLRWTLPRFSYGQTMSLGWKILLPLSLVNLVITALVVFVMV